MGSNLFVGCDSLEEIRIPAKVSDIGSNMLNDSKATPTVFYAGSATDWAKVKVSDSNEKLMELVRCAS